MIRQIEERIKASDLEVRHRDVLVRLRAIIEGDLQANEPSRGARRSPQAARR